MNPFAFGHRAWLALGVIATFAGPCAASAVVAGSIGIVTIVDGSAQIVRDSVRFAAIEGLRLQAEDLVLTATDSRVVRVELSDGGVLDLGPSTQAQLQPRPLPDRPCAVYLATGWAKLASRAGQTVAGIASPRLDLAQLGGAAVLQADAQRTLAFVESGRAELIEREAAGASRTLGLREGESYVLRSTEAGVLSSRPSPALLQGLPRALADQLPRRATRFQSAQVAPGVTTPVGYADVALWINGEAALRVSFVQRFAPLAKDRGFRAALLADLRAHPEWRRVLFAEQLAKARAQALAAQVARSARAPTADPQTSVTAAALATPPTVVVEPPPASAPGLPLNAALVETRVVRAN